MKKWILIGCCSIIVIIAIVVVLGVSNLGPVIKEAVNTYGPSMTQTDVKLGDVSVSLFSAEAELKDVFLGNPKGFKSLSAMNVGSIFLNVDEKSITSDTIIIDKIEVVAPEITYEKAKGTDNFKTILGNVNKAVGADKTSKQSSKSTEKSGEGKGKNILIKELIVRDGKVGLSMSILGNKAVSASLPDIHLKDIGKKEGGVTPSKAFKQIFAALHEKITSPAVTDIFNKELKNITNGAKTVTDAAKKNFEAVGKDAEKTLKSTTDKMKGLLNN